MSKKKFEIIKIYKNGMYERDDVKTQKNEFGDEVLEVKHGGVRVKIDFTNRIIKLMKEY